MHKKCPKSSKKKSAYEKVPQKFQKKSAYKKVPQKFQKSGGGGGPTILEEVRN